MGKKGYGNEKPNMSGNALVKGRKAGVQDTYGSKDKRLEGSHGRVAERTVATTKMDQSDSGSLHEDLTAAAKSIYSRAVAAPEDGSKMGDQALRSR